MTTKIMSDYPFSYIDTGMPRHVLGHMISGGVANALIFGMLSQTQHQDPALAAKTALKRGLQGALAAGVATDMANILGNPMRSNWDACTSLALGAAGIYLIEKGISDGKKK